MVRVVAIKGNTLGIFIDEDRGIALGPLVRVNVGLTYGAFEMGNDFIKWVEDRTLVKFDTINTRSLCIYYEEFLNEITAEGRS